MKNKNRSYLRLSLGICSGTRVIKMIMLCLMFGATFLCTTVAYADFGPKDKLVVHVKNPPNEPYYLDLLEQSDNKYDDFNKIGEREVLNEDMLKLLFSYEDEGLIPSLASGGRSGPPKWGKLVGELQGNEMIHTFGYDVPKTYQIIIVTQRGKISVSDVHTRYALQSSVTYDYSNGKTTVPPIWISYIMQYCSTYIPTLIIEGIILILFGFELRDNWKPFLLINAITQVILTLTVGIALIKSGIFAYMVQFPVEIIITITESILFRKYLVGKTEALKSAYGVIANIASWGFGFISLGYQWEFMLKFM